MRFVRPPVSNTFCFFTFFLLSAFPPKTDSRPLPQLGAKMTPYLEEIEAIFQRDNVDGFNRELHF